MLGKKVEKEWDDALAEMAWWQRQYLQQLEREQQMKKRDQRASREMDRKPIDDQVSRSVTLVG